MIEVAYNAYNVDGGQQKPGTEQAAADLKGEDKAEKRREDAHGQAKIDAAQAHPGNALREHITHQRYLLASNQRAVALVPYQERHNFVQVADGALSDPAHQRGQPEGDEDGGLPNFQQDRSQPRWHDEREIDDGCDAMIVCDIEALAPPQAQHASVVEGKEPASSDQHHAACEDQRIP